MDVVMTIDQIEDVLFDGTDQQIRDLAHIAEQKPLSYAFVPGIRRFELSYGSMTAVSNGVFGTPQCANVLGDTYSF
jgi:hypothetical protein